MRGRLGRALTVLPLAVVLALAWWVTVWEPHQSPAAVAAGERLRPLLGSRALSALAAPPPPPPRTRALDPWFKVEEYGAVPNSGVLVTAAVAQAVEKCAAYVERHGGPAWAKCSVVFAETGIYLCGPITLHSGVFLHVDEPAVLSFVWEEGHYLRQPYPEYPSAPAFPPPPHGQRRSLIRAYNATRVGLTGAGAIDGGGEFWSLRIASFAPECAAPKAPPSACASRLRALREPLPPRMVEFTGCTDVFISEVTLRNPPLKLVHVQYSQHVRVEGARLVGSAAGVGDALVIDSSAHVLVARTRISGGGLAVALRSGEGAEGAAVATPVRDVLITDLQIHGSAGVALTPELAGGASNVTIRALELNGAHPDRIGARPPGGVRVSSPAHSPARTADVLVENVFGKALAWGIALGAAPDPEGQRPHLQPHPTTAMERVVVRRVTLSGTGAADGGAALLASAPAARPLRGLSLESLALGGFAGGALCAGPVSFHRYAAVEPPLPANCLAPEPGEATLVDAGTPSILLARANNPRLSMPKTKTPS